ncbi:MAG: NAD(P) transhydrogenase subunit alpha [Flavobacteriales bacterium]|nr:NAD(P) transhydrogenase subunit alpha [Flavobacteriales bacterium]
MDKRKSANNIYRYTHDICGYRSDWQSSQRITHAPERANAIHGVVIIGAIIVMGKAESDNNLALVLGFLAVIVGTLNVVGGFVVTDRMLEMFKKKKKN